MQASGISVSEILALGFATVESPLDLVKIVKTLDARWLLWNTENK